MKHLFLAGFCATVGTTFSATINVASFGDAAPSLANAQAAYNAALPGDTIIFPPNGSATWSSRLTIGKPLTIVGNGTTLTAGTPLNTGFFFITGFTSTNLMRVTGFTFNLVDFAVAGDAIHIANDLALNNLRIDHNTFRFGYTQIVCYGAKGVIDHNYFYDSLKGIDFSAGSVDQANASWASMAAGTGDALFIEDNHFIDDADYPTTYGQEKIGTENGGKLVVRYNEFGFDNLPLAMTDDCVTIMTHGNAPGGVPADQAYWQQGFGARRGQSVVEIYNNNMHGRRVEFLCILRGSANLVFKNTLTRTSSGTSRIYMREEESTSSWVPSRTEWPAEDQVHNTFLWSNTFNGSPQASNNIVTGDLPTAIMENRDYWLHEPQDNGGKEVFTGANGAAGSFPTDGSTYPTKGTMVFTPDGPNAYFGYTPYTYPHPLTTGQTSGQLAPAQNLRAQN